MNNIPDWFDLKNYERHLTIEEWVYEIWVRSFFFQHASFFNKAGFNIREHPVTHYESAMMFGLGLSVCVGNYKEFLRNRNFFWKYFELEKKLWNASKERPAIEIYEIDDIFPGDELAAYPEIVNKDDFVFLVSSWCDRKCPIGINLERTDEELFSAFKNHLKECREEEKELFALAKNVSGSVSKWHEAKLLAQFDLLYWRDACDTSLTYGQIAQAIWPRKSDTDIEQNLRKHGISKIEKVFSIETAKALYFEHMKTV